MQFSHPPFLRKIPLPHFFLLRFLGRFTSRLIAPASLSIVPTVGIHFFPLSVFFPLRHGPLLHSDFLKCSAAQVSQPPCVLFFPQVRGISPPPRTPFTGSRCAPNGRCPRPSGFRSSWLLFSAILVVDFSPYISVRAVGRIVLIETAVFWKGNSLVDLFQSTPRSVRTFLSCRLPSESSKDLFFDSTS